MSKLTDKFKNLWTVPEELEEDDYERNQRSSRRDDDDDYDTSRRSRSYDEYDSSRRSDYDRDDYYNGNKRYEEEIYKSSYNESSYNKSYDSEYNSNEYDEEYSNQSKVLNINAKARLKVIFFKPESFNSDAVNIADHLMKSYTVLLNFEETPRDESKRIVDFLSGSAYVSGGKVQRIARNIFIITPNNVELTGDDLLDELQNNGLQIVE
ncbi:MAG: cell division protein SepF [Acutalibacteraceae bacterium]|nr:cell division protein SepF [Acutalibacteraceae bacterium]